MGGAFPQVLPIEGELEGVRIVFMGTPDFAVQSLRRLVEEGFNVVGVVTMPDKPIGRHHDILQSSPVKKFAQEKGIPVLQPEKLRDEAFLAELKALKPDLQIVVAFRMLPQVVWALPPLGTFNLHAALLPQYRGAAPINWAIINGDTETGVTTFFLDEQIDTGRIILQERTPIKPDDNAEDVHDKLMVQGAELVIKTVRLIESGEAKATDQSQFMTDEPLRPAPKIFKETCQIRWQEHTLESAYNFIRGLSPYPAAWTPVIANGKETEMKVFKASKDPSKSSLKGETLRVELPGGFLYLDEVQLAGKKRMPIADLLNGTKLSIIK
ncbi:MAG: methionyl-tRNA formyltransferase [Bacteroidaceae bacterium]|nr:methionyl-tRNA formyltransferase [Bacteroidaceae bacterium]